MHKNYPGTHTAGTIKSKFKGSFENCIVSENAFLFMSAIGGSSAYQKQFLCNVSAMVNYIDIKKVYDFLKVKQVHVHSGDTARINFGFHMVHIY